jgi:hypothetical protein
VRQHKRGGLVVDGDDAVTTELHRPHEARSLKSVVSEKGLRAVPANVHPGREAAAAGLGEAESENEVGELEVRGAIADHGAA